MHLTRTPTFSWPWQSLVQSLLLLGLYLAVTVQFVRAMPYVGVVPARRTGVPRYPRATNQTNVPCTIFVSIITGEAL